MTDLTQTTKKRPGNLRQETTRTAINTDTLEGASTMENSTPFTSADLVLDSHDFFSRGTLEFPHGHGAMQPVATIYRADKLNSDGLPVRTEARLSVLDSDGEQAHILMSLDAMRSLADWLFTTADEISAEVEDGQAGEQ